MRSFFVYLLAILCLPVTATAGTRNNQGNYLIRYYGDAQYRAHPVSWVALQDDHGKLFFGNRSLVITYNGVDWQRISVRPNAPIYDMKTGPNGKIYIGLEKDIGYIETTTDGQLIAHSLLNRLPDSCQNFVNNWKVHTDQDMVYFQSNEQLVRMKNDQFDKVWKPKEAFHFSFQVRKQLYITEFNRGLMRLENDSLVSIDDRFGQSDESKIYAMIPLSDGSIMIISKAMGFFLLNPYQNDQVTPLFTPDDKYIRNAIPYNGTRLSNGQIAISTRRGGVILIDEKARIERQISTKNGLKTNDVRHVLEDRQGAIWLSTHNGIHRVAMDIPLTYWDNSFGLDGVLNHLIHHGSDDYIATSQGVYRKEGNDFYKIPGINQTSWYLSKVRHGQTESLIAATDGGLYQITKKNAIQLTDTACTYVYESPLLPGTLWVSEDKHLRFYQKRANRWVRVGELSEIIGTPLDITQDKRGNTWVGTKTGGLFKIERFASLQSLLAANLQHYGQEAGLTEISDVRIKVFQNAVLVLSGHSLFQYNEQTDNFSGFALREQAEDTTQRQAIFLDVDNTGAVWAQYNQADYSLRLTRAFKKDDRYFQVENVPFKMLPRMLIRQVLTRSDGAIIILGNNALICYEAKQLYEKEKQHRTIINKVIANQDHVFQSWISADSIATNWGLPSEFSYDQNELSFWFSTSCLRSESDNRYQYQLEGDKNKWSDWSSQPVAYYTNLYEGDYRLKVRSMGFDEEVSSESTYAFTVLPPWYRSTWAYALYVMLSACFLWMIVILNTRRIRRSKKLLEVKVAERTAEIVHQNKKIRSQQDEIIAQNEELQMLNKEKNFLLGAVAHDLKNPLNSIYSVSQLIKMDEDQLDNDQREYIDQIANISLGLTDKVNEILDVTVIDAKQRKVPLKRGEVSSVIKEVVKNLQPVALRKNITLVMKDCDTKYFAFFEVNLLKKALQNLLDNAIKFSPRDKKVFISVSHPNDRLCISIKDQGPGVVESDKKKLFQRFTPLTARPTAGEKSTGLGLSIVKRCVEAMNGTVRCESDVGYGANFIIEL